MSEWLVCQKEPNLKCTTGQINICHSYSHPKIKVAKKTIKMRDKKIEIIITNTEKIAPKNEDQDQMQDGSYKGRPTKAAQK